MSDAPAPARHAIVISGTGGPEVLAPADLPVRELGDGELRVATTLAGVNFWDVMQRRGDVPMPPDAIPGVEGVGIVTAAGPGAPAELVGARVAWSRVPASYATVVQGPAASFVPVPPSIPDDIAASVLMQGITAQYLAESTTDLGAGQTALVTAAAGGVGSLLAQFLRARGVRVLGVVGSAAKTATAERAGALPLVDGDGLAAEVRALAPEGVDAVFDAVGGDTHRLLDLVARRGICVLYGAASGRIDPIDPADLGAASRYVTRTAGRDYTATPDEWRERADDVLARAAAGTLAPVAVETLPLDDATEAHRRLEGRSTVGKLLLAAG